MQKVVKEILYDWLGANQWLFLKINKLSGRNEIYDKSMVLISRFSDPHTMYIPSLIFLSVLTMLAILWGLNRNMGTIKYLVLRWVAVVMLFAVAFPVNAVVNYSLKDYFAFPRPYKAVEYTQVQQMEKRKMEDDNRSFPSGHMAFIVCLVLSMWEVLSSFWRKVGLLAILAVGWSRIALGVHFPADVIWSWLITVVIVFIMRDIIYSFRTRIARKAR
jgi:membrane-associated phospholipid phosphatase